MAGKDAELGRLRTILADLKASNDGLVKQGALKDVELDVRAKCLAGLLRRRVLTCKA